MRKYIILVLAFCACKSQAKQDQSLNRNASDSWDKEFSITLYNGGGMIYQSLDIEFNADSVVIKDNHRGNVKRLAAKLTEQDKTQILDYLEKHKVESIRQQKFDYLIYDKGSTRICLNHKNKNSFCLEEGATEGIVEKDAERFRNTYQFLSQLAWNKVEDQKINITLKIDNSVWKYGQPWNLYSLDNSVHISSKDLVDQPKQIIIKMFSGKNSLYASMLKGIDKSGFGNEFYNAELAVEVIDGMTVELKFDSDKLLLIK